MTKKNLVGEMLGMEVAREYKADFIDGPLSYDTLVGVEIEYEHSGLAQFPESAAANLWRRHEDGSLRDGGAELVFRAPLSGGRVVDAIAYAELALKRCRFSTRTSVHVHVDVRDITPRALLRFLTLYYVFEEVLFAYCGPERKFNNFCMSGTYAAGVVDVLANIDPSRIMRSIQGMDTHTYRYASVNLDAVRKFGSLEFRGHRGTCDSAQIIDWINMLLCLKQFAVANKNVMRVLTAASSDGAHDIMREAFPNHLYQKLLAACTSSGVVLEEALCNGARLAQDIMIARDLIAGDKKARDGLRAERAKLSLMNPISMYRTEGILPVRCSEERLQAILSKRASTVQELAEALHHGYYWTEGSTWVHADDIPEGVI